LNLSSTSGLQINVSSVFPTISTAASQISINTGVGGVVVNAPLSASPSTTGTVSAGGQVTAWSGTAPSSSGKLALKTGNLALGFGIWFGSGAPTINQMVQGSLYLRTDGTSTSSRVYVADSSSTWTSITTLT
jgi:hypothetical protein